MYRNWESKKPCTSRWLGDSVRGVGDTYEIIELFGESVERRCDRDEAVLIKYYFDRVKDSLISFDSLITNRTNSVAERNSRLSK